MRPTLKIVVISLVAATMMMTCAATLIGDSCACPCSDGEICAWYPETRRICDLMTVTGTCDCISGNCPFPPVIMLLGIFPEFGDQLDLYYESPGSCCTYGCNGECFQYCWKDCFELHECISDIPGNPYKCDAQHPCNFEFKRIQQKLDWWRTGYTCCYEIQ